MKKLKGCLSVIVLLMIIGAIGSAFGKDSRSSANTSSNSRVQKEVTDTIKSTKKKAGQKKTHKTYGIGDVVKVGNVEYTVNSVSQATSVGSEYFGETAQGVYLLVNITVKNNGKESLSVSDDFFKIYKGDTEYKSDSEASLYANDNTGFFLEEINPGNSVTSTVAIDVPQNIANAKGLQLQVQTGVWGTEKARINIQ
ncbi:Telomeric repeat-binding factor 2 [Streptococcus criceti]|uniref:DUF4352 domain-containing protein n=1 Tax=Streptococcus criceti HS-6 TaxID=873449 RepID=G5JRU7_STRCG|nr:DUF4352 domain-containing protein [Streptococcus criceti]EHI74150.1 hypothetical protein STRCR_0805 [Streptococcus criceti HS-6]SUN43665.1 Telomeric repeat-binding factor 2 [Streptococcus criceti]